MPWVDESGVKETLRRQDGVEVEAGQALDEVVVGGDEVVGEIPVEDYPVGTTHPLKTEGQTPKKKYIDHTK